MAQYIAQVGYGLSSPLPLLAPFPIKANRVPTTADKGFAIGQLWVYVAGNAAYILTSVVNNLANWQLIEVSGGAGVFTTLTSTGQFNLDTTAVGVNTLGNTTGATSISSLVGTGGYSVDGVGASNYTWGASTTTGTMAFGGTAGTGAMTFGSSSGTQAVGIGVGAGISTVNVATGTAGNTVNVATGANTVAQVVNISSGASGADSTVNILSGNGTAGTQTFNALTGTRAGSVNLGTGAAAHAVAVGSTSALAGTAIRAGATGGLSFNASGNVTMIGATATVASPTASVTSNFQVGNVSFTGFTTASGSSQVFTVTNSLITTASQLFVSACNEGSNDAQMTIQRVNRAAGSFTVTLKNNGAAALNGNVAIQWWSIN